MVSYMIMADGAIFSATTEELQITVAANPVFSDTAVDEDYTEDSEATIQIAVGLAASYLVTLAFNMCFESVSSNPVLLDTVLTATPPPPPLPPPPFFCRVLT